MKFSSTKANNLEAVRKWAKKQYSLGDSSIHGPEHWEKVFENGVMLAGKTPGADVLVVKLFSLLHDCRRENDHYDPDHGRRAAGELQRINGSLLHLSDNQLVLLEQACSGHADGYTSSNPTIGCCWDADRLELPRAGIKPRAQFLSTEAARNLI